VRRALGALLLAALIGGCGSTTVVQEKPVVVTGGAGAAPRNPGPASASDGGPVRITVVTHGQASSPFWAIVRNGVDEAARQLNVTVTYRAPDIYSLQRMQTLIEQAVDSRPDGLVVSLPEPGVGPAVRDAVRAGIPVVSINSGSDTFRGLGILAHVGQIEGRAGFEAGKRLAAAGVRRALCVNQQVGNQGLDERCAGLARAMREAHGKGTVLPLSDTDPKSPAKLATVIVHDHVDGVLTTNATGALNAIKAVDIAGRRSKVTIGTFDLGPDVLTAVRSGRLLFAVDQQPFLQGYLPVMMLAQRARYGLFPAQGDVVPTGPHFVTRGNAEQAIRLSKRAIR
jgi:simple sugar transport system substrate-binding protein